MEDRLKKLIKFKQDPNFSIFDELLSTNERVDDLSAVVGGVINKLDEVNENLKKKLESELVLEINKEELRGDDGYTPIKGVDYFDGQPGKDAVITESLIKEISTLVMMDIEVPVIEKVIERVEVKTEPPQTVYQTTTIENPITTEDIFLKINEAPIKPEYQIDFKHIKNWEQYIPQRSTRTMLRGGSGISQELADARYLKLDASNDPITGNVEMLKSTPMVTLTDSGSGSYGMFTVSSTEFSIDFGLNGAEIPASLTSNGSTITFSPTGIGGLTFAVDSLSFLTGYAGINGTDYTFKGDPATGGSNLDGGDLTMSPGAVTGTGKSDFVIKAAGGNSSGSTAYNPITVGTWAYNKVTLADPYDIALGTTTGTKIGTATSQKLGFWNATPIVQPTTSSGAASFTANAGTAVNDASTFDGYTLKQVVKALRDSGLLA